MRRPSWSTIFVFAVIAIMLAAINARPAFPDPDSFYHAKMALMIRDHGFISQFPWMQEAEWRDNYVDPHMLYHVVLIPFVTAFDPLVGMKVSAVVFGLLAFFALYRLLRAMESPYPEWLTLAAAFSFDFLHRMSLPRAPSISVATLILAVWAMHRGKWKTLFFVTVGFVWLYYGWAVLVAAYGCVAAGALIVRLRGRGGDAFPVLKTGLAVVAGIAVGLVANPYFPENVRFAYDAIVDIGVREVATISVGSEWTAPNWPLLFFWNLPAIQTLLVSVAMLWVAKKNGGVDAEGPRGRLAWGMSLLALFFLVFALRSIRYAEYLIPFVTIAAGSILALVSPYLSRDAKRVRRDVSAALGRAKDHPCLTVLAAVVLASLACLVTVRGINYSASKDGSFSEAKYGGSARWLRENVPTGTTVFHSMWDSSMIYFYLDDSHYYLVGLDPRFMFDADAARYGEWEAISTGRNPDVGAIVSEFGASAVLVDRRLGGRLVVNLDASPDFARAYEDEWAYVYVPRRSEPPL